MKSKNRRSRNRKTNKVYNKIKNKYNSCFYCGKELAHEEKTIEHIIPLAHNGGDNEESQ